MKATEIDRFSIPDVQDAESIETLVARLRKGISSECSALIMRMKAHARAPSAGSFRIKVWESRINRIIESNASTFDIGELRRLRRECVVLSDEIGRFEA
jgi:hypothetical protein